jgi:phospholipase/carboxylesterase
MMELGQYELIRQESPPGIEQARTALTKVVDDALTRTGLSSKRLLLGGFSQGAMVAMECACCALAEAPGAMALYSCCLIRENQWRAGMRQLADTKILQSHGEVDPILPLQTGLWLRDLLIANGCQVEFLQFAGPHTISWEAIEQTARLLDELAAF